MNEIFMKFIVICVIFITIYIIMEFKADNFINGKNHMLWFLLLLISIRIVYTNDYDDDYYAYIPLLFLFAITAGCIVFLKNKIYLFKGIDKKLINENRSEIKKIIDNYKDSYVDYKSEITFFKNRIVFEGVNKQKTEECLLLVGRFLNENRKNYTVMNYSIYILKTWILPLAIVLLAAFIAIKLIL